MRIASRFEESVGEKCPICLGIGVNFLDLGILGGVRVYACTKPACGCLFVPKGFIEGLDIKSELERQVKFVCECGLDCKTAMALNSHKGGEKCPLSKK